MPPRIVEPHAVAANDQQSGSRGQRRIQRANGAIHFRIDALHRAETIGFGAHGIPRAIRPQVMCGRMRFAKRGHHEIPFALLHQPLQ